MSVLKNKNYLDAQTLLEDAFRLAEMIMQSGFSPSFIVAIWRGGVPIGIAIQEYLAYHDIDTDHISIRTTSYSGIDEQARKVKVLGFNYLVHRLQHSDRLLIVDDVFDTGRSVEAIIKQLKKATRRNMPKEIRMAVPYYKPTRNELSYAPDYYLHETEDWLKFPHSLEGLSHAEIQKYRPEIYEIIKDSLPKA